MVRFVVVVLLVAGCGGTPTNTADDMAMAAGSCADGVKSGDETDVDCGGSCAGKCGEGKGCGKGSDCQSMSCLNNACIAAPAMCGDGKKDGSESDVDCGGAQCPKCADGKACGAGGDCQSGACLNNACIPMPAMCGDGKKDGSESDVDCGGAQCPKCADGKACGGNGDCTSGMCQNGTCATVAAPTCNDQVKNGQESDVDCGGPTCGKCANGKACGGAGDCQSNNCSGGSCAPPPAGCTDAMKNGSETDVDCGGAMCPKCPNGKACVGGGDCTSGNCAANLCAPPAPTCNDQVKNAQETDVDCGGAMCPRCALGKACAVAGDCASGNCAANVCAAPAPTCNDQIKNAQETDVDCGGALCPKCALGKTCGVGGDCQSNNCMNGVCAAPLVSCMDQIRNGQETDVDCGGAQCPKCANGKACQVAGDCSGGACNANSCANAASCMDALKNAQETDVDCGGPMCGKCANGKHCLVAGDCLGGACKANLCANAPNCMDQIQNGLETDVDCGGGVCPKCGNGLMCNVGGDCVSTLCSVGTCLAPPISCMDAMKNGSETDVDCGGAQCSPCTAGKACKVVGDCQSHVCTNLVCQAASCVDMVRNGVETDVDCGGAMCPACVAGKACSGNADCQSMMCVNNVCANAGNCVDGVKNGMETDVDCGGPTCVRCGTAKGCMLGSDCVSNGCANQACTSLLSPAAFTNTAANGYSLFTGDVNGDGKRDVVMAGGPMISVLLGTGMGTFQSTTLNCSANTTDCALGDFNADGKADLVCANFGNGLSLYLGNGNGFDAETLVAIPNANPQAIGVADLNADGILDVVIADNANARVSVLLGQGAAKFAAPVNYAAGTWPWSLVIKDVTQDGKADLVVANGSALSNSVSVLAGKGDGTFAVHVDVPVGDRPHSVAVDDVNADGKPDLVVANAGGGTISVLLGTGGGAFAPKVDYGGISTALTMTPRDVAIVDLNADGIKDIVIPSTNGNVEFLRGKGDGTFLPPLHYLVSNMVTPSSVVVGDFNGDGKPDVVTNTTIGSTIALLLNLFM